MLSLSDLTKNLDKLTTQVSFGDLPKVLEIIGKLRDADLQTGEGARAAVQLALESVCPLTAITKTAMDDPLCPVANALLAFPTVVSLAGAAVYRLFGRRADALILLPEDVKEVTDELDRKMTEAKVDGAPQTRAFISPTTVVAAIQFVVELLRLARNWKTPTAA